MDGRGLSSPISGRRVSSIDLETHTTGAPAVSQSLHAEIGAPHSVVGGQRPMGAFEHHPTGFEHIPLVARFQSFSHTLLHQQQCHAILAVECRDAVED
jgi:hypothetical protein